MHVFPIDDLYEHEMHLKCWCVPRADLVFTHTGQQNYVVVHTPADGRQDGPCGVARQWETVKH